MRDGGVDIGDDRMAPFIPDNGTGRCDDAKHPDGLAPNTLKVDRPIFAVRLRS